MIAKDILNLLGRNNSKLEVYQLLTPDMTVYDDARDGICQSVLLQIDATFVIAFDAMIGIESW